MARTAAPERSTFFVRCNLVPSARNAEPTRPEVGRPVRSFDAAKHELLSLIEQAVAGIKRGEGHEPTLHEIGVTLRELEAMVERDPGIRMAADDLYEAAAIVVAGRSASSCVVDARQWRLLREAVWRLRDRLASAQPSEKARHLGLS